MKFQWSLPAHVCFVITHETLASWQAILICNFSKTAYSYSSSCNSLYSMATEILGWSAECRVRQKLCKNPYMPSLQGLHSSRDVECAAKGMEGIRIPEASARIAGELYKSGLATVTHSFPSDWSNSLRTGDLPFLSCPTPRHCSSRWITQAFPTN